MAVRVNLNMQVPKLFMSILFNVGFNIYYEEERLCWISVKERSGDLKKSGQLNLAYGFGKKRHFLAIS